MAIAKRYGLVIDLERCTGCNTCTVACKVENKLESISGIRVETIGGPHRDTPAGVYPQLTMYFLPVPCMHCQEPPCLEACPVGAIEKRHDGIVVIKKERCDACQACIDVCPYGAITYDEATHTIWKCNMCYERLDEGFEPFCALCCGMEAIFWGDVTDPDSEVSRLIRKREAYILKPEMATGPAVYYCPPRSHGTGN
jgi:Fe-S-cluster-containing dehydrogenase component